MGFRLVIFPNSLTRAFAHFGAVVMAGLKAEGTTAQFSNQMLSHKQLWSLFESETWLKLEAEFGKRG
jgi:2,3-dimethylmalate lyase